MEVGWRSVPLGRPSPVAGSAGWGAAGTAGWSAAAFGANDHGEAGGLGADFGGGIIRLVIGCGADRVA